MTCLSVDFVGFYRKPANNCSEGAEFANAVITKLVQQHAPECGDRGGAPCTEHGLNLIGAQSAHCQHFIDRALDFSDVRGNEALELRAGEHFVEPEAFLLDFQNRCCIRGKLDFRLLEFLE